jgi:hypothetical protein
MARTICCEIIGSGLILLLQRLEDVSSRPRRGVVLCMFSRHFLLAKFSRHFLLAKFSRLLPLHIYSTTPSIPNIHLVGKQNEHRFYSLSSLYHILHTNHTPTKPPHKLPTGLVPWTTLWALSCWALSCGCYGGWRMHEQGNKIC